MAESIETSELNQRVARIITEEVMPLLQMDGSGIEVLSVEEGVVQVRLQGVCGCCPASVQTVIMGIEDELRRRVPEIEYLEVVP